jgi:O-antigen/teichoic acid export membrane protein
MVKVSEKKSMFVGVLLSYITIAVGIVLAVFYTPFLLESLGTEQYGIRTFAYSVVSYLSYLSVGMASCYLRYRLIAKKRNGEEGDKHFNGLFFVIFLIIGAAALIIGLFVTMLFYTGAIPLNDSYDATDKFVFEMIMLIDVINIAVYFPLSTFRLFINSEKKFIWLNSLNLIDTILSPIVTIIIFKFCPGQFLAIDATLIAVICSIFVWVCNLLFAVIPLKFKMTLKLDQNDLHMFKEMVVFSIFVFLLNTASSLNAITDKVVLGFIVDSDTVTKYQLSVTFLTYLTTMSSSIGAVFIPRITQDVLDGDMDSVERIYKIVSRTICIMSIFIIGGYISCGRAFMQAWILNPEGGVDVAYCNEIFNYSVVLMIVQTSVQPIKFSIYIDQAMNKHKIPAVIYIGILLLNIIISITLCMILAPYGMSIWGCVIGTVFAYICEGVSLTIYSEKYLHFHVYQAWVYWLIEAAIAAVPVAITLLLYHFVDISSLTGNIGLNPWIETLIRGGTYIVLYLPLELTINHKFIKQLIQSIKQRNVDKKEPAIEAK